MGSADAARPTGQVQAATLAKPRPEPVRRPDAASCWTMVKRELRRNGFSDEEIDLGGLRVVTTFTTKAMRAAGRAVRQRPTESLQNAAHRGRRRSTPGPARCVGDVRRPGLPRGRLNWADAGGSSPARRSSRSPWPPALEDGSQPQEHASTATRRYDLPGRTAARSSTRVGDGTDYGSAIDLIKATEESVNTAYVDLTDRCTMGPQKVARRGRRRRASRQARPG